MIELDKNPFIEIFRKFVEKARTLDFKDEEVVPIPMSTLEGALLTMESQEEAISKLLTLVDFINTSMQKMLLIQPNKDMDKTKH